MAPVDDDERLEEELGGIKARLREARRGKVPQGTARAEADARIEVALFASELWRDAKVVVAFAAIRDEPATRGVMERALSEGRQLFLPRVHPTEAGVMQMLAVESLESLEPGRFGVLAPPSGNPEALAAATEQALVLVPGVAFDLRGHRLGQGGGYYDRFLSGLDAHAGPRVSVGLAYEDAIVGRIPKGEHDTRVEWLLTEAGLRSRN